MESEVAPTTDISEATVRNRYKELEQQLNLNLNDARKLKQQGGKALRLKRWSFNSNTGWPSSRSNSESGSR